MPLFLKALDPDIEILGNRQTLHFNNEEVPMDNAGSLVLVNHFNPDATTSMHTSFEMLNVGLKGYRLYHEHSNASVHGNIALQTHSTFGTSEDIFKYDESTDKLTFFKNVEFDAGGIGTVTSIGLTTSGTGLTASNSPITTSGDINLTLSNALQTLSAISSTGFMSRNSSGNYLGRSITATTDSGVTISNGDGVSGNPTIGISTLPINKLAGYPSNSSQFLRGDSTWAVPTSNITLPLDLYGSLAESYITIYNSNSGSTGSGFAAYNQNTSVVGVASVGVEFGMNNSTNEGYVYCGSTIPLKFGTNGTTRMKINADGSVDMFYNRMMNAASPLSYYDVANKGYVDSKVTSGIEDSESISVNTQGSGVIYPSNNYLRRSYNTLTGVQIYGIGTSTSSFMIENYNGESAGIGFNGNTDGVTIWTAGDSGSYLNIQDEDNENSRQAYVDTSGAWVVVSSSLNKHSIRNKANNNVLDRFLKLSVKSYGLNYDKKNVRTEKKSNKMNIGFVLEDLFKVFPNCIGSYYNKLGNKKSNNKPILEDEVGDIKNSGINYNNILCYLTMAFQEYVTKTNNEIENLKKEINYVKNK